MANRDMKLDVLVRLRDQMTGGLNKLSNTLNRTAAAARKIGAVGGIIAGISFIGPMQEAAAFQQQLIDIAGTAELTGKAAFAFVDEAKAKYEQMALGIGQASQTIADGAGLMIAAGVDVGQVQTSIQDIGEAATAANAQFNDMAGVATSMLINLKVPAEDIRNSLSALVVAGKSGSFELKDMAKEFPNLTSQVAKFGVTGREAVNFLGAGLQIAMKGAAQTSVAANNFSNFLSKTLAPRTVKNFEEMGVDIQRVMQDAATKGINPLEAVLQKVQTLTGVSQKDINSYMAKAKANGLQGAEALGYVRRQLEQIGAAGKISELFTDQQVLDFLVPMMANIAEYKSIKDDVARATGTATDADFATQIQGINRQMTIFKEVSTQASREVGIAFGGWLPMVNSGLIYLISNFRAADAATGGWLKKALSLGAGTILLAAGIGALGVVLPVITAGFSAIGAVLGVVLGPLGIVIGLLAGAAALIYKNWDKVAPKLAKFWNTLKRSSLQAWNNIKSTWARLAPSMSQLWDTISVKAGDAWQWLEQAGVTAWEGLSAAWEGFKPSLQGISESLQRTFGNLGGVWENIKGISSGLMELGVSIARLMGIGDGTGQGIARWLGQLAGSFEQLLASGIEGFSQAMWVLSGAIRTILDLLNGKKPNWRNYFPNWLIGFIDDISSGINNIRSGLEWLSGKEYTTNRINSILDRAAQMPPQDTNAGRNSMSWRPADDFFRNMVLPPQKIDNKVEVRVKVDGPGTASATVNSTKVAPVTSDGGLAVGRP